MTTAQDQQSRAESAKQCHDAFHKHVLAPNGIYDRGIGWVAIDASGDYQVPETKARWLDFHAAWQAARALPAPENVREGEPYDNPAFEDLARTMGVWGTAQAALCAQFFLAGRASPAVDKSPDMQGQSVDKGEDLQGCAPADQWKCGNEFLPYHPSASHVEPAYRDGWNACFKAAAQVLAMGRVPPEMPAPDFYLDGGSTPCFYASTVQASLSAAPRPPAAMDVPTEDTTSYLAQMFGPGPTPRPPAAQDKCQAAGAMSQAQPVMYGAQAPTTGSGRLTAGAGPAYRLLQRGIDTIQEDDEFLRDDAVTWQVDPQGIFVGMPYMSNVLLPARRAIEPDPEIK